MARDSDHLAQGFTGMADKTECTRRLRIARISLRVLVMGVGLLCLILGIKANRASKQRNAVAAILASGGRVSYEHVAFVGNREFEKRGKTVPKLAAFLDDYLPHDWVYDVKGVALFGEGCNDDVLSHVGELSSLESLGLWASAETPSRHGFGGRADSKAPRSGVSDEGLKSLASLRNLDSISFLGNSLTDEAVPVLMSFPALKRVQIDFGPGGSKVTRDAYAKLERDLEKRGPSKF